ncbi:DNA damage-regulated autophagy modulator protein 2-like [Crassostrea angulata]|uniref:DNA damage-regulated autophagy modulator protein 2-like n=1 Tax=Magallana angulata TaxID=2784310 RepID=UPI0022B1ECD4|nr:DNA damage-regulated autophagy modulator protein 2-like [Crassostrea angulata]
MLTDRLHLFPLFIVIYVPVSFCITYIIAVANKHVEPGFPYISDTGTLPPESCVFGQLLNIGAVVGKLLIDLYIVIYQVQSVNENHVVF